MSLPVKIGNYRFERNLGNGTFGKVKCKSTGRFHLNDSRIYFILSQVSFNNDHQLPRGVVVKIMNIFVIIQLILMKAFLDNYL